MLLRSPAGGGVLAITQPAHAALVGRLAGAWDDEVPAALALAAAHHDDVWLARDAEPRLNRATSRPETFLELEPDDRVGVWSRAPLVAVALGPESELWVLRHAERLHAGSDVPAILAMTAVLSDRIAALIEGLRADHDPRFGDAELARGSALLTLWDTLSLALCFGVSEPRSAGVLALSPRTDGSVAVAPWPFAGDRLDTWVQARRLPDRLEDQVALDAAWRAATPFPLDITLVRMD